MSAIESLVLASEQGETYVIGPFTITGRVLGPQSGETFELYEVALGPATIDYHVHNTMDETLCVVEGTIQFLVAGETYSRGAGSVAYVPKGVPHGFTNPGPGPARVLALFTPAGRQSEYFRAMERLFAAPELDTAAVQAVQREYDQELVPLQP